MPSEPHVERILRHLEAPVTRFRSAVAATAEQIRGFLESHREEPGGDPAEAALLGAFASGRVDASRFHALLARPDALDPASIARIERALAALRDAEARIPEMLLVSVEPGGSLHGAVAAALAAVGRVFGAARLFDLVRGGRYREAEHAGLLESLPFDRWTRAERASAPPLVVRLNGRDLRAGTLAEFLDGGQKIVIFAAGETAVAPLVRLVTPGTFVLQTGDGEGLDRFAAFEGPGVAAWLPAGAALFLHDPEAGAEPHDRLRVAFLPEAPAHARAGQGAFQQWEELKQLKSLASRPAAPAAPEGAAPGGTGGAGGPGGGGDPADRLAAWLLSRANL